MKELELKVKIRTKDLWQFSMYHTNGGVMGVFNVLFTAAALFLLITQWGTLSSGYRVLLVACVLMFPVIQPLMLFQKAARQAKAPAVQGMMTLCFSGSGLTVMQGEQKAEFTWEQIGRVDKQPTMLVIYMDRVHAYLVPKDQTEAQQEELLALLREYLPKERRRRI